MGSWITLMLKSLDKNLDESRRISVMETCGEDCPFTHLSDEELLDMRNRSEDEQDLLEKLSRQWRVKIENEDVYVVFDQCYCPLVGQDIEETSKTLCYCTQGNIKKKFRIGFNRDVDVLMEKSILAGDDECRFRILL